MTILLNIILFVGYVGFHVLLFSLCASAAEADRTIKKFPRE